MQNGFDSGSKYSSGERFQVSFDFPCETIILTRSANPPFKTSKALQRPHYHGLLLFWTLKTLMS